MSYGFLAEGWSYCMAERYGSAIWDRRSGERILSWREALCRSWWGRAYHKRAQYQAAIRSGDWPLGMADRGEAWLVSSKAWPRWLVTGSRPSPWARRWRRWGKRAAEFAAAFVGRRLARTI